jgi:hypothetical protein
VSTVWIAVVVLVGVAFVTGLARLAWSLRPQADMSGMPPTPLEKLGWIGLGVTTVVGLGLVLLVVLVGSDFIDGDTTARGVFWLLMMGGIAVWAVAWWVIKRRSNGTVVDERDRAILARSLSVESVIVLLTLVTWTVVLTEVYSDEGSLPLEYLQLIFWSTFILGAFGRSLGIVMGYRREIVLDA